jgi:hypothetical protein
MPIKEKTDKRWSAVFELGAAETFSQTIGGNMVKAKEILEYAKQAGWIDIATGIRLFTREYLQGAEKKEPPVIETSPGNKIIIKEAGYFNTAPFWFIAEPEKPDVKIQFNRAANEERALVAIKVITTALC